MRREERRWTLHILAVDGEGVISWPLLAVNTKIRTPRIGSTVEYAGKHYPVSWVNESSSEVGLITPK